MTMDSPDNRVPARYGTGDSTAGRRYPAAA